MAALILVMDREVGFPLGLQPSTLYPYGPPPSSRDPPSRTLTTFLAEEADGAPSSSTSILLAFYLEPFNHNLRNGELLNPTRAIISAVEVRLASPRWPYLPPPHPMHPSIDAFRSHIGTGTHTHRPSTSIEPPTHTYTHSQTHTHTHASERVDGQI